MNFLPLSKQLDLFSFQNYIFSIGVYNDSESELWRQVFYPMIDDNLENTIIFAIDADFKQLPEAMVYRPVLGYQKIQLKISFQSLKIYSDSKRNITLVIIPENLPSHYEPLQPQYSFRESLDYPPMNKDWIDFFYFIDALVLLQKNVYINNWVFFYTRTWKRVNGRQRLDSIDQGHFFENFPELGFILNIIALIAKKAPVYIYNAIDPMFRLSERLEFSYENPLLEKYLDSLKRNPFLKAQKKLPQKQQIIKKQQIYTNYPVMATSQDIPIKSFETEESIRQYIANSLIYRFPVPKDGACLFSSIAKYLKTNPTYIRNKIVSWERQNMQQRITHILAEQTQTPTFRDYLQRMSRPTTFGGEPEIISFTENFKHNVVVIDVERNNHISIFMSPEQPAETLFLLYYKTMKHYDVAWLVQRSSYI